MKNKQLKYFFLFISLAFIFHYYARSQVDTTFWFVAPEVTSGHADRPIYLRMTSSGHSSNVTISFPARPWVTPITQAISANSTVSIDMTSYIDSLENKPANTVLRYGIKIKATDLITAYYEEASSINPDIFTLKGAQALGLDFYIPGQNQYPNKNGLSPMPYNTIDIVATQNNTQVTIIPSHPIVGHAAGIPFTVTLNRGQTYSAVATSQAGASHLYGTRVYSNKPIAITVTDDSLNPTGFGCYDLNGEQIVPVSVLGSEYAAIHGSLSFDDWIFVIGAYPNTNVFLNGNPVPSATISAGGIFAYQFSNSILYIKTSQPAYVWHLSGFGCETGSTLLPSIKCTGSNTVSITRTTSEYFGVNLITSNAARGSFKLNGTSGIINASAFSPVPGTSNAYWAARIDLSSYTTVGNANTITNTAGLFHVGVIHGGSSSGCRYGYFSGFSNLYLGPDALICSADTLTLDGGDFKDSYHWSTGDTVRRIKTWYTDTFWVVTTMNTCTLTDTIIIRALPSPVASFNITSATAQCLAGNRFDFLNISTISTGSNTLSHYWKFGDNTTSTAVNPFHVYSSPGNYIVKLIVTSLDGCRDSMQRNLTVYSHPDASFTLNDTSQCLLGNQFLTTNTTAFPYPSGNLTYHWTFGDGGSSFLTNPVYQYLNYDTFTIRLIAISDKNCRDSAQKTVYVFPMPVARFTVNDSLQCLNGNHFQFNNSSTIPYGSLGYSWDFGDDSTAKSMNPVHNYLYPDTFNVRLICNSGSGCKDTAYLENFVLSSPVSRFTISDTAQCLSDNLVKFTNLSTIYSGTMNYNWYFGDGDTTRTISPQHFYLDHDTFTVKLKAISDNACTDSTSRRIYIFPMPDASFIINDSSQCFRGNNFNFSNTSTISSGSLNYYWNFGDNNISLYRNTNHTYLVYDTFNVRLLTTSDFGCEDSFVKKVIVFPQPGSDFSINDTAQCLAGNKYILTNLSVIPSGGFYNEWNYGDNSYSNDTNSVHSYLAEDTFSIMLKVVSTFGCRDSAIKPVVVYPMPVTGFWVNDSMQCFNANSFSFYNSSSISSGNLSYFWDFGGQGSSVLKNPVFSFRTDDSFIVLLKAESSFGCKDSISKNIVVMPSPVVDFSMSDTVQCLLNNELVFKNKTVIHSGNMLFYWKLGDGNTSTARDSVIHQYISYGNYNIKLKARSVMGCEDSLSRQVIIHPMPSASFGVNDSAQCFLGNSFNFINLTSIPYGSLDYYWTFNDGNFSTSDHPVHSYNIYGNYIVKLVATSMIGCKDTVLMPLTVYPMPQAGFVNSYPCLQDTIHFTSTSVIPSPDKITGWEWDFGDGGSSYFENPAYVYFSPGLYSVRLKVTSQDQCQDIVTRLVTVNEHVKSVLLTRATVVDDKDILVEWESAGIGIPDHYIIERSVDEVNFSPVRTVKYGKTDYTDPEMDVDNYSFSYRIKVIDSCDYEGPYSNLGKTILLTAEENTLHPILHWTHYKEWSSGVKKYFIRIMDNQAGQFINLYMADSNESSFTDDITKLNQGEYCYLVVALSQDNIEESYSNIVCVPTPFNIFVPGAFTPNGDGLNDRMEVNGTYIMDYHIVIFNCWGEKIYESDNIMEGWDGTFQGSLCPVGYYYYRIIAKGTAGQGKNVEGMVMLLR